MRGPKSGNLLVVGWGGTYGAIYQALEELKKEKIDVSQAHLFYLNPFPKNTGAVLKQFKKILVPELNSGHLRFLFRNTFPELATQIYGLNKVQGQPFKVVDIYNKIKELL